MRWPWDDRLIHDLDDLKAQLGEARGTIRALQDELRSVRDASAAERDRYERLVDKTFELKREGFTPPRPDAQIDLDPDLPKSVMAAILERAEPGTDLYSTLVGFAKRECERVVVDQDEDGDPIEGAAPHKQDPNAVAQSILAGIDLTELSL